MQKPKGTPSSYDIIGDILILEFRKIVKNERKIAEYLLSQHKNVKVIAKKMGKHAGRYRAQKLKIIAGEKRKKTVHKESGVRMELNAESCYFSPRLSAERLRIVELVRPGEEVLVMFSGVAPYPLVIAKNAKPKAVYGIEMNPHAHKFAEANLKLNKLNNIKLYCGDVRKVLPKLKKKFDRIIMPLPKTAEAFLPYAKAAAKRGATIHYYTFGQESELDNTKQEVLNVFPKAKILRIVKCGQYSPHTFRLCIDFKPQ